MTPPSQPLHVEDSGHGTPVVLLHSSGMSGRQWRRAASALVDGGARAVVPDLTGHGKSAEWREPTPFSFRLDVEKVVGLLESLPEPAHLVGHSYGGLIALQAALASPARARSLTLYDPVAFGALDPAADADARRDLDGVSTPWQSSPESHERWLQFFVDYWNGPGGWSSLREEARAEFRRVGWVINQGVTTLVADATRASAYRAIPAPTLLLTGERSPLGAQRVVQRLTEGLVDARVVTLPGAGHMGPLTHGEAVAQLIVEWITKAGRST